MSFNPLDPNGLLRPKKGITSIEAAEMWLEDHERRQKEAAMTFDMDGLERAALRRKMGFDYEVTIHNNRFVCRDMETGYKTTAFYDRMDEKAVKRLVRALMRLKKIHDTPKV